MPNLQNLIEISNNNKINRIYFDPPHTSNNLLNEIILKYYYSLSIYNESLFFNDIKNQIKCINIDNYKKEIFNQHNILIQIIVLSFIIEFDIVIDCIKHYILVKDYSYKILTDMLMYYNNNKNNIIYYTLLIKTLGYFINNMNIINLITDLSSEKMIYEIVNNNYKLNSNTKSLLLQYLCFLKCKGKLNEIKSYIKEKKIIEYIESIILLYRLSLFINNSIKSNINK